MHQNGTILILARARNPRLKNYVRARDPKARFSGGAKFFWGARFREIMLGRETMYFSFLLFFLIFFCLIMSFLNIF